MHDEGWARQQESSGCLILSLRQLWVDWCVLHACCLDVKLEEYDERMDGTAQALS
jgi:hypothetical protein